MTESDQSSAVLSDIAGDYTIDPTHSRIGFSVRHAMVSTVRGSFQEFSGTAHIDTADPASSSVALTISAQSITTGNEQRDGHVKTGDFMDIEQFPELTFTSTDVSRDGDVWNIVGDLAIKGVSHPVTVPFEFNGSAVDPFGNVRIGFEGSASLLRKDYGLTYNAALEAGGVLISDKVKLEFDVSAIKNA